VTGDTFVAFILLTTLLTLSLLIVGPGLISGLWRFAALTFIGLIWIIFEKSRSGFPGPSAGRGKGPRWPLPHGSQLQSPKSNIGGFSLPEKKSTGPPFGVRTGRFSIVGSGWSDILRTKQHEPIPSRRRAAS
jgi:hypothetical protein